MLQTYLHPGFLRRQARWSEKQIAPLPNEVSALLREGHESRIGITQTGNGAPFAVANRWLMEHVQELRQAHVHSAYFEDAIRDHAENYARLCSRMNSLESRQSFALYLGIAPPAGRTMTAEGRCKRLDDSRWWRRQLRRAWTRASEDAMRELGAIRKGRAPYASDEAVRLRANQRRRGREFLQSCVAINEVGEQMPLLDIAEKSLANPRLRRGEFMCRCRGFEAIAADLGHVAEFITLTAPSAFHAQSAAGGANPHFIASTVREAQRWLCKMWARVRAKLKRLSIAIYGFRIAEPHHDATPHWHGLFFVPKHHADALRAVVSGCFLSEFADEHGAREHRVRFERIDPTKGSATGYIAKYVSKNIDGAGAIGGEVDDETGSAVRDGINRVDAWASVHGIRQFQQIGGAPVGLWREARRLRACAPDPAFEIARAAADRGDWATFVQWSAGLKLWKEENRDGIVIRPTGECNRYGELIAPRVVGLQFCSTRVITRPHSWRIERTCTGTAASSSGRGSSKTGVCTDGGGIRIAGGRSLGAIGTGSGSLPSSGLGPVAITVRDRISLKAALERAKSIIESGEPHRRRQEWEKAVGKLWTNQRGPP